MDLPTAAPPPTTLPPAPAAGVDKVAWIATGTALFLVLHLHLLSALLAGLLVHALIHSIGRKIEGRSMSHHRAKLLALGLIAIVIIGGSAALILLLLAFLHGKLGHLPTLLGHMAAIIETARDRYGWQSFIPATEELKELISHTLRGHAGEIERTGGELGRGLLHAFIGIVIGAITAFHSEGAGGPLSRSLLERLRRLSEAFQRVVFAQVRISLLNTTMTAVYLLVALPLFHVHLPLHKTLVILTFVFGLIPVVGNLLSNTAIVVISLGFSLPVAISSLVYLVVIHKLEYFLNARIVGREIRAAAWELLVVMLVFESAFGIPGVIAAPIFYAYAKAELVDRGLV
ncbi:MAG TPA: AI-2E family transporter [Planctomycetota bacterium]|nr:AI-2E family transporter [Planctomycetota bacterium]